jgi:hypothetical protein
MQYQSGQAPSAPNIPGKDGHSKATDHFHSLRVSCEWKIRGHEYYPTPAQLSVGPWVTPPSNIVNIPELRNIRCFRESSLARDP